MLNKDKPSLYSELVTGEWFTDAHGGICLKCLKTPCGPLTADDAMPYMAINLISGMEVPFDYDDVVYRQQDLKLSILFPHRA